MQIIEKTLWRETVMTLLVVTMVLIIIILSSQLAKLLALAAAGEIPADTVFTLLGLQLPAYISILMPLGMMLAVLLTLGRMAQDNELVILLASGIGFGDFMKIIARLAAPLTLILLFMSLVVSPAARKQSSLIEAEHGAEGILAGISPGRFNQLPGGNRVIYISEINDSKLIDVFVYVKQGDNSHILRAPRGEINYEEGYSVLKLYNGNRVSGVLGTLDYTLTDYDLHGIVLAPGPKSTYRYKAKEASIIDLMNKKGARSTQAELQWRFAIPIMGLILIFFGVALTSYKPRSRRFGAVLPAVALYVVYTNLISISRSAIEDGNLAAFPGIWWVHALMTALLVAIIYFKERKI